MNLIRMTAIAAAATIVVAAPALAGPLNMPRPQLAAQDRPIEQIAYHHHPVHHHVYHPGTITFTTTSTATIGATMAMTPSRRR